VSVLAIVTERKRATIGHPGQFPTGGQDIMLRSCSQQRTRSVTASCGLLDAAVVAAAEPVDADGRVALVAQLATAAAVLVVLIRATRDGAISVDDQRTGTHRHESKIPRR
jgi:hypothetical protein